MQTLHEAQLSLAVPRGHKYADRSEISFHDISDETLLYLSEQEAPVQHALLPFSCTVIIGITIIRSSICPIWRRWFRWCGQTGCCFYRTGLLCGIVGKSDPDTDHGCDADFAESGI